MRRKHLESALSSIQREFPSPNIALEQYPTSAELGASVILFALERGDIGPNRSVCDLGCGTGLLSVGCALVESDFVLGVDCDADAVQVAATNAVESELYDRISFVVDKVNDGAISASQTAASASASKKKHQKDSRTSPGFSRGGRGGGGGRGRGRNQARSGGRRQRHGDQQGYGAALADFEALELADDCEAEDYVDGLALRSKCVDTVMTNPPFGTKNNAGIDVKFLKAATRLARRAVYSFHKTSTRPYLVRTVTEKWGMKCDVVAEMKFDIPQTYSFHKQKCVDIEVDLLRIQVSTELDDAHSSDGTSTTADAGGRD